MPFIYQQLMRGEVPAQKPKLYHRSVFCYIWKVFFFFFLPFTEMIKRKEDTENIWLFLVIPCALKMLGDLPLWFTITCFKRTTPLERQLGPFMVWTPPPPLAASSPAVPAGHSSTWCPQTHLPCCIAFENFHKLYPLLEISSFALQLS